MDLKHDWKALNEVLFHQMEVVAKGNRSIILIEDDGIIVDGVVSTGAAFTDRGIACSVNQKSELDQLALKYGAEDTIVLSKKEFDQHVIEAALLGTNYFQQLQSLRERILMQIDGPKTAKDPSRQRSANALIVSRRHFILDLFGTVLRRILPRRFNVLLFVDQRSSEAIGLPFSYRAILLSYSGGKLDQFFEPDFSSLHENRLTDWGKQSDAIGQYLESRYLLPCYGIFMHKNQWDKCLDASRQKRNPWTLFVRHYDGGHATVYPNGIVAKTLLATQRLMVYFSRA